MKLKQIEEPSRKIPVMAETDVLVIGGGPGGLSAALASGREGVDTMLVERYGCFGGVITQAMIGTIAWYRSHKETVDAGGIGVEFEQRAKAMGASTTVFFYEILDCGIDQPTCTIDGYGLIRPTGGSPGSRTFPSDFRLKPAFDALKQFIIDHPEITGTGPSPQCSDGVDNDGDTLTDLDDDGC